MQQISRLVTSPQQQPHVNLEKTVARHLASPFKQPVRDYNLATFKRLEFVIRGPEKKIILDSGCGTGESTQILASLYEDSLVLGVDKSAHRLNRHNLVNNIARHENCVIARADLVDFWRLAAQAGWKIDQNFLFYPNPWPKPWQLQRRWYAHPVFPDLLSLGGKLEIRTNWPVYAKEFSRAIGQITGEDPQVELFKPLQPVTPFERKYHQSGHKLYRVVTRPLAAGNQWRRALAG